MEKKGRRNEKEKKKEREREKRKGEREKESAREGNLALRLYTLYRTARCSSVCSIAWAAGGPVRRGREEPGGPPRSAQRGRRSPGSGAGPGPCGGPRAAGRAVVPGRGGVLGSRSRFHSGDDRVLVRHSQPRLPRRLRSPVGIRQTLLQRSVGFLCLLLTASEGPRRLESHLFPILPFSL